MTVWDAQLLDTATFYTISLSMSGTQQKKTETLLYEDIPCNLVEREAPFKLVQVEGQEEQFTSGWRCDVEADYGGANIGDRVTINSIDYIIQKKVVDTDFDGNILFYKYDLKQKT